MRLEVYTAKWCGPSQLFIQKSLSVVSNLIPTTLIDIDDNTAQSVDVNINSTPTFILYDAESREIERKIGAHSALNIGLWLDARTS